MAAIALEPDEQLDLRGTPCPINFVRTKLKLQQMAAGALLEVWLDAGEPIEQVPDSLTMAGYAIEFLGPHPEAADGHFVLQVRKPAAAAAES
ncbi:sulfurtransferase TusA family protein [Limnothrix sp. FACHB-881]|uniref:sulfurtransferase TusA family protein n=1 Tax=unclassified Limnothrix TaxID=2632864 RepID=UPI00081EF9C0|nr:MULTISPECIES: sulfurtransferase TusA family protein [unclassified Limnothrix]OCQ98129.1 SirA-like domain-containing protein [Limnothrix sp. P13C2]MBD2161740.1 sulfurtransferase TusA family protein [Limnothrix sp. FACHB-1083]MBD2192683.1 sulfurtransferase TusA family protein [Limnothrix sp. FACHB-1088]MBD2554511.1 sulfurtransferase TusA family protein [Limnothrix sp. FACHB-708]MBD2591537.1 sulfurtransferase TusA family protein [Limnothrix sp. FACHB-406]